MAHLYNVYCDESCHLEFDQQPNMVLGAISAPRAVARHVSNLMRDIKRQHNLPPHFEVKWAKVSPGKLDFYLDILNLFFRIPDLRFRGVIAEKKNLNHAAWNHSHEEWYYIMYYLLLDALIDNRSEFAIYLDIKDDKGQPNRDKLRSYLCRHNHDFLQERIIRIQGVQSHEVELVQMVDLFIGTLAFANRKTGEAHPAQDVMVQALKELSHYSLLRSTPRGETKFNLFHWEAREAKGLSDV